MKKIVKILISLVLFISLFGLTNTQSASAASAFIKPNNGSYTSYFGGRTVNGIYGYHYGVDIGANGSTLAISASASGKVQAVLTHTSGLGKHIILRHTINGQTFETVYGHLSAFNVQVGQTVTQGQNIGTMGNTGNSTGTHLHFEIHEGIRSGNSTAVDPLPYINGKIDITPTPEPIPHTYDGTWATLRTKSLTGSSTVNTFAHAGYGLNGTLPTGSLYRVYEKQAANGTDYFRIGYEKWIHRDNSEITPYVATAKYTSPVLDVPGGTKIAAVSPGDSHKTYGATTTSNGRTWYLVGNLGWVDGSYLDVVRIP